MESHAEFLRRVSLDEELAAELRRDYRAAKVSDAERVMLDFVVRMTHEAYRLTSEDVDRMKAAGFTETALLQVTLIAAWFNYVNRVADALGVGKQPAPQAAACPPGDERSALVKAACAAPRGGLS